MDVNQAYGSSPVGEEPKRSPKDREKPEKKEDGDSSPDSQSGSWRHEDAVDVGGVLAAEASPEVYEALEALTSQLEPLRAELDRAHEREKQLTEMTQNHPFLPVHNRREFLRELTHVLNHMEHLSTPPALILVHASNADAVRLRAGRNTLDAFLERFASTLDGMLHPTDVIGSLGGNDFGIVVLTGSREAAESVIEAMTVALDGNSLSSPHGTFPLVAKFGYAILEEGMTAERAVADADADLRRRR